MKHNIQIGDIVHCVLDDFAKTYIYVDKVGKKFRLVSPGLPNVSILVDRSQIYRTGPWR
jgi:hypothetical protein